MRALLHTVADQKQAWGAAVMDVAAHPGAPTMRSICVWSNIAFHGIHPTSGKSEVFNGDEHAMNASVSGSRDHMKLQIVFHRQPVFPRAAGKHAPVYAVVSLSFPKLPSRIQGILSWLHVIESLEIEGLVKIWKVWSSWRFFFTTSNGDAAQILQLLYGFTKGPVVFKTADAIHHRDVLDRDHPQVLDFFIPPRVSI